MSMRRTGPREAAARWRRRRTARKQRLRRGGGIGRMEGLHTGNPRSPTKKRAGPQARPSSLRDGYFTFFFEVPFAVVLLEVVESMDWLPVVALVVLESD